MYEWKRHKRIHYLFPEESGMYRARAGRQQNNLIEVCIAYQSSTPGLIVHKHLDKPGWNVTHEASGLTAVSQVKSRRLAFLIAGVLGGICEWTQATGREISLVGREALERTNMLEWLRSHSAIG
jgi:hypothetical protein